MKYIFIDRTKILPFTKRMEMLDKQKFYKYANEEDVPISRAKELVVEDRPEGNVYSWYEETKDKIIQHFRKEEDYE